MQGLAAAVRRRRGRPPTPAGVVEQRYHRRREAEYPHLAELRHREGERVLLVTERRREARGLELALGDQRAVGAVGWRGKQRRSQQFHEAHRIDVPLADEGESLPEGLDGGGDHE